MVFRSLKMEPLHGDRFITMCQAKDMALVCLPW
jgi:hypothetical protein